MDTKVYPERRPSGAVRDGCGRIVGRPPARRLSPGVAAAQQGLEAEADEGEARAHAARGALGERARRGAGARAARCRVLGAVDDGGLHGHRLGGGVGVGGCGAGPGRCRSVRVARDGGAGAATAGDAVSAGAAAPASSLAARGGGAGVCRCGADGCRRDIGGRRLGTVRGLRAGFGFGERRGERGPRGRLSLGFGRCLAGCLARRLGGRGGALGAGALGMAGETVGALEQMLLRVEVGLPGGALDGRPGALGRAGPRLHVVIELRLHVLLHERAAARVEHRVGDLHAVLGVARHHIGRGQVDDVGVDAE